MFAFRALHTQVLEAQHDLKVALQRLNRPLLERLWAVSGHLGWCRDYFGAAGLGKNRHFIMFFNECVPAMF